MDPGSRSLCSLVRDDEGDWRASAGTTEEVGRDDGAAPTPLPTYDKMPLDMANPCASLSPDRLNKAGVKEGEKC